jgi:hypothetical protein
MLFNLLAELRDRSFPKLGRSGLRGKSFFLSGSFFGTDYGRLTGCSKEDGILMGTRRYLQSVRSDLGNLLPFGCGLPLSEAGVVQSQ